MSMPFQTRLVMFFLTLFVTVELLTVGLVYLAIKQRVIENSQDALVDASYKFQNWFDDIVHHLTQATEVLASDDGFREAVIAGDYRTIRLMLNDLRDQIDVDHMLLVDQHDAITIDKSSIRQEGLFLPVVGFINSASPARDKAMVAGFEDRIYQLVIVPVADGALSTWIGVAVEIDDSELLRLRELSFIPIDITFALREANAAWRPIASTLMEPERTEVAAIVDDAAALRVDEPTPESILIGDAQHVAFTDCPTTPPGAKQACAVFQYSVDAALFPYRKLFYLLAVISLIGVMLTLTGCLMMSRSITRPLRVLDAAARRICSGDYAKKLKVRGYDEIGRLSSAFNEMMNSIAAREKHIAYQLRHDMLTGLPNRLGFETSLSKIIENHHEPEQPFSILLLDIQRFSEINNTLGHDVADQLLKNIGAHLQASTKQADVAARIANSSFSILLHGADVSGAVAAAKRLSKSFDTSFSVCRLNVDVSVRIGVATYPDHGQHPRSLLRHAEVALSLAKESVHGYAIYSSQTDPYRPELLSLMSDLRVGLKQGEFSLHYQPKMDLATGRPKQVEALVRWKHGQHGLLLPEKFIPLAERTGYIQRLTRFVIRTALKECREWQSEGFDVGVAINLSVEDLLDPAICASLAKALANNNLDPQDVTLEITETAVMAQPEYSMVQLKALASLGVNIAIDDYGTGYSSMAYVKRLPVNELKIDKAFVMDLANSKEDEIIVHSTIELGHNLGLKVTAEGVEDAESLAKLEASGCDFAQGFWFAKPVAKRELLEVMAKLKPEQGDEGPSATVHHLTSR